jgi:hypothetical protein
MPLVLHKKFIHSFKPKRKEIFKHNQKQLSDSEREELSDSDYEDVKPKKRRLTTYNKFMRNTMPSVREKYPGQKRGQYMQIIGAMWKSLSDKEKQSFNKKKIAS